MAKKKQEPIKFIEEVVSFQDVPYERTLTFAATQCDKNCPNCYNPLLKKDTGEILINVLAKEIERYLDNITCVLIIGGTSEKFRENLLECFKICRSYGLKTAIYSVYDEMDKTLMPYVDYYKIKNCDISGGRIKNPTTKQRLYQIKDGELKDLTYVFQKTL